LKSLRIAVLTKGEKGLEDEVAEVFGKAKIITIVDVVDGEIKRVQTSPNPGASCRFGSGPITTKTLAEMEVDVIVAGEIGPGASAVIEDYGIARVTVKPGIPVSEAIKAAQHRSDRS